MAYDDNGGTFEATERLKVDGSSLVEEAAYDADSRELIVFFRSGTGYLYSEVPAELFSNFRNAHSKGQFYNNWIKRGDLVVANGEVYWDTEVLVKSVPAPSMGPISLDPSAHASVSRPAASLSALGHDVQFVVEGGNGLKHYHVETGSVEDAVDALYAAAAPLDLNVTVKGVYTSFE